MMATETVENSETVDLVNFSLSFPQETKNLFLSYYTKDQLEKILKVLVLPPRQITVRACNGCSAEEVVSMIRARLTEIGSRNEVLVSVHDSLPEAVVIKPDSESGISNTQDISVKRVIIDRLCGESVLRGSNVFIPGILCCSAGVVEGDKVEIYADIDKKITRGSLPERHIGRLVHIGSGIAKTSRKQMLCSGLHGIGIHVLSSRLAWKLPSLNEILPVNKSYSQSIPAMVTANVLLSDFLKSEEVSELKVLDMCAAPGGKTTHIAQLLKGQGLVIACDRSRKRALKLADTCANIAEINCASIIPLHLDVTKALLSTDGESSLEEKVTQSANSGSDRQRHWKAIKRLKFEALAQAKRIEKEKMRENADLLYHGLISRDEFDKRQLHSDQNIKDFVQKAYKNINGFELQSGPSVKSSVSTADTHIITDERIETDLKKIVQLAKSKARGKQRLLDIRGFYAETFDAILLDGPCSALGLRPRLMADGHMFTPQALQSMSLYQRKLIDIAVQLLRPGGTLVYSTCTINPLENECNVSYALKNHKCLSLVAQHPFIGQHGLPGTGLSDTQLALVQRFDPSDKLDTCGFFCAKFRKSKA